MRQGVMEEVEGVVEEVEGVVEDVEGEEAEAGRACSRKGGDSKSESCLSWLHKSLKLNSKPF